MIHRPSANAIKIKAMNWGNIALKVGIIIFAIYIFMQKEVNFQVQLHSPLQQEQPDEQHREQGNNSPAAQGLSEQKSERPSVWQSISASLFGVGHKIRKQPTATPTKVHATSPIPSIQQASDEDIEAFIERFSHVAMSEMRKYGIPASIILANGLLQSEAGQGRITAQTHNYFRIPCSANWSGDTKQVDGVCYRKYESAWAGFRGNSEFIQQQQLPLSPTTNYRKWTKALEKTQLWPHPQLAQELNRIIEAYDLYVFDK